MSKMKKREFEAYNYIKQKIESNEWPPQKHIREQDVATSLNMSRTPIRHAFSQLERDQLIQIEPYKGAKILPAAINSKTFQQRIEFIELMMIHYLMKLEKSEKQLELEAAREKLMIMRHCSQNSNMNFEEEERQFWKELLGLETNRYSQSLILNALKELQPNSGKIRELLYRSRQTKMKHYDQLINYLEDTNYPYARREVRILLNQLLLNVIQNMDEPN